MPHVLIKLPQKYGICGRVPFRLSNLASGHKHTCQYLKRHSGADVVNDMATLFRNRVASVPIPPFVVKTRGEYCALFYLQYPVEVMHFFWYSC